MKRVVAQNGPQRLPATLPTEESSGPSRNRRVQEGSGVIGQVSIQHRSSEQGSLVMNTKSDIQSKSNLKQSPREEEGSLDFLPKEYPLGSRESF